MAKPLTRLLLLCGLFFSAPAFALPSITVMADSSMSAAVSMLARSYSKKYQAVVNTSFAQQGTQEQQIVEGQPVDVVITPRQSWIDSLKLQGLVDGSSQQVVAKGKLALIGPKDSGLELIPNVPFPTTAIISRMNFEPGFLVGYPELLMEGVYGAEALRNLGAMADIEPYTLYVKEREQLFSMVENNGNYGIVFYASALGRGNVRVLALLPQDAHRPIDYYGVAVAGENMAAARQFLSYMKSAEAKQILTRFGFSS